MHGGDADREDERRTLRGSSPSTKSIAASASFPMMVLVLGKCILLFQKAFYTSEQKGQGSYFSNGVPGYDYKQSSPELETAPVKVSDSIWQRIKVHTCLHASASSAIECRPSTCYSWMLVTIKTCQRTCLLFSALQGCSDNRCLAISSSDLFETENTLTEISSFPSSLNYF